MANRLYQIQRRRTYKNTDERAAEFSKRKRKFDVADLIDEAGVCTNCNTGCSCQTGKIHQNSIVEDFVISGCGLDRPIPVIHGMIQKGKLKEAFLLDLQYSPMGRLMDKCPSRHGLCRSACIHSTTFGHYANPLGSVNIPMIEVGLHEKGWEEGWVPPINPLGLSSGKSIGFIGAGFAFYPAALAALNAGHAVESYDRNPHPGGQGAFGIYEIKRHHTAIDDYFNHLARGGAVMNQNVNIGASHRPDLVDLSLEELIHKHDYIMIGTGRYGRKPQSVQGDASQRILHYQNALNRRGYIERGEDMPHHLISEDYENVEGKITAVEGAGDTGIDIAVMLGRLGAKEIHIFYHRKAQNMGGDPHEKKALLEEYGSLEQQKEFMQEAQAKLDGDNYQGKIKFHFETKILEMNHAGPGFKLKIEKGGREDLFYIDKPLYQATGAKTEQIFGLPAKFISSSNAFIVDQVPQETVRASNTNIVVAGKVAIAETRVKGATKLVEIDAAGDCVSDSQGRNSPGLLVQAIYGGLQVGRKIVSAEKEVNKGTAALAEKYPHLVFQL